MLPVAANRLLRYDQNTQSQLRRSIITRLALGIILSIGLPLAMYYASMAIHDRFGSSCVLFDCSRDFESGFSAASSIWVGVAGLAITGKVLVQPSSNLIKVTNDIARKQARLNAPLSVSIADSAPTRPPEPSPEGRIDIVGDVSGSAGMASPMASGAPTRKSSSEIIGEIEEEIGKLLVDFSMASPTMGSPKTITDDERASRWGQYERLKKRIKDEVPEGNQEVLLKSLEDTQSRLREFVPPKQ